MITNLVALVIVTNAVWIPCPFCDAEKKGIILPVVHEHKYEYVVTTNYLPVVVDPRKRDEREIR